MDKALHSRRQPTTSATTKLARATLSSLPPELVRLILDRACPPSGASYDWLHARHRTLTRLCLVSVLFAEVAMDLLYKDVLLVGTERARQFARTLTAARWVGGDGKGAGQARRVVRSVRFDLSGRLGSNSDSEGEENAAIAAVLEQLNGGGVTQVGFREGLLYEATMAKVSAVHPTHFELLGTDFRSPAWPYHATFTPSLPTVTHLAIQAALTGYSHTHHRFLLHFAHLPALTHLTYVPDDHAYVSGPGLLDALAPQLVALRLEDDGAIVGGWAGLRWSLFGRLRHLRLGDPEPHVVEGIGEFGAGVVRRALAGLPHSLETLDIASAHAGVVFAANAVRAAFAASSPSVAALKVLWLPKQNALVNQPWSHKRPKVEALERVAAAAEARGVKVEWVEVPARLEGLLEFPDDPPSFSLPIQPAADPVRAMPASPLPTELLRQIVLGAVPAPKPSSALFPITPALPDAPAHDLHALSLVSTQLNAIATEYLYRHLVVPDAQAAKLLIRTLTSDEWTEGAMKGVAEAVVKTATFGKMVEGGCEAEGGFVGDVLEVLEGQGARLDEVRVEGLKLDARAFRAMNSVRSLSLSRVELALDYSPAFTLPSLTHLSLYDTRRLFSKTIAFLSPVTLPSLTSLSSTRGICTDHSYAHTRAAFLPLLPQIRRLHLAERRCWLGFSQPELWERMTGLEELSVVEGLNVGVNATAIKHLPAPLRVLDLRATSYYQIGPVARDVGMALARRWPSVAAKAGMDGQGLEVLRLPDISGLDCSHPIVVDQVVSDLMQLSAVGLGCGVRVEGGGAEVERVARPVTPGMRKIGSSYLGI